MNTVSLPERAAPRDPLSDVLRSVHMRGAIFYWVSCRGDWVATTPPSPDLAHALCPGAEHVIAYHWFARGSGWVAVDGAPPQRLSGGDVVIFPRGDAHVLSSAPGLRSREEDGTWRVTTRADAKPILVALHDGVCEPSAEIPVEDADAVFVCGFISCDRKPFNPLIDALPAIMHMGAQRVGPWVGPMLEQAVAESRRRRPGSEAVLERVSEMVFVDAARRYLESLPEGEGTGWFAALRDRFVGRAIALMHDRPADPWTVDELGRHVGLSRSALHERFVAFVGQPPMQYLANWRMQLGSNLLRDGNDTVAAIAQQVGYETEAAFSRAFKRATGQPPAAWRRAYRAAAPLKAAA